MAKHHGQIIEHVVRKLGYSITDLANELKVNRRTIYNYFENEYLKYDVIYKIGIAIRHDFSNEFPEFFTGEEFIVRKEESSNLYIEEKVDEESIWKDRYISLLEDYNLLIKKLYDMNSKQQC